MLRCINIIYNNTDCLFLHNQPNQGVQRTMVLVVIFFNFLFFAFVPIFDLVHAVDSMLLPLKLLRTSQNLLRNMSDARENAICSCICIYHIAGKKSNAVSSLHRLCIASASCNRSNIATEKLKKYENQRINGPVNAHLISGPSIRTKHRKPG